MLLHGAYLRRKSQQCTQKIVRKKFHPENYNNHVNNNSHMMNICFHKGQDFPFWEGEEKSSHASQKFAHSSPHLEKFPPVDSQPCQIFIFPTKFSSPQ